MYTLTKANINASIILPLHPIRRLGDSTIYFDNAANSFLLVNEKTCVRDAFQNLIAASIAALKKAMFALVVGRFLFSSLSLIKCGVWHFPKTALFKASTINANIALKNHQATVEQNNRLLME